MLALAIIIAVALSLLSPYFLKTNNLLNLLDQSVVTGIVAIGMTFVILTGGIDLSVGSVVGLTGVILGLSLHHFSIPIAITLATLAGAGIGLFSGLLIAYFDLAAFVITLGVMAIGRSLAYIFSGQTSISDIPPQLNDLVYTEVFGIQANVLTLLVLYALAWAYLTYTKGGRTIYAVGREGCEGLRGCAWILQEPFGGGDRGARFRAHARPVRRAEDVEEDSESFQEKMKRLVEALNEQFDESAKLQKVNERTGRTGGIPRKAP